MRSRTVRIFRLVLALTALLGGGELVRRIYFPDLPAAQRAERLVFLNGGTDQDLRQRFYHTPEGSLILPYRWFLALEQFSLLPLAPGNRRLFRDPGYLERFRLLPSPASPANPDALPVGLARTVWDDPQAGGEFLGLTCAACHTGELHYRGTALRIDGGSALVNLNGVLERMMLSLAVTVSPLRPWKLRRFAERVLGEDHSPDDRAQLRREVLAFLESQFARGHRGELEGALLSGREFGRMDALATGGNQVFLQLSPKNFEAPRAPAVPRPLWSAYDYDWGLSNGAVRQPLARNVIQSMAVGATVELAGGGERRFISSVRLEDMAWLDHQASRLGPPSWPEGVLGPIDRERAARGRRIFAERCAGCHVPPWSGKSNPPDPVSEARGKSFLELRMVPLEKIGTDPSLALNFAGRRVAGVEALGIRPGSDGRGDAAEVIRRVVAGTMDRYYRDRGIPAEVQSRWSGGRSDLWRARKAYSARPLAGVWATPPYLHHGSVANVYQLLSPVAERDRYLYLGNREYDPELLGYRTGRFPGSSRLDTHQPGSSNCGHEFRDPETPPAEHCRDPRLDASRGRARLGPALSPDQRRDLIELLKALPHEAAPG